MGCLLFQYESDYGLFDLHRTFPTNSEQIRFNIFNLYLEISPSFATASLTTLQISASAELSPALVLQARFTPLQPICQRANLSRFTPRPVPGLLRQQ
jgi:hypothetical protein